MDIFLSPFSLVLGSGETNSCISFSVLDLKSDNSKSSYVIIFMTRVGCYQSPLEPRTIVFMSFFLREKIEGVQTISCWALERASLFLKV
jgi:hypothetical protein